MNIAEDSLIIYDDEKGDKQDKDGDDKEPG